MVCGVGYRNVGLTVKMATALDHASDGRAMLGLGAGWHEPEHRAFGYEVLSLGDRIGRFDEASRVARGMLDGESVTYEGRWISGHDLRNDPPPLQGRMPLLIGGSGGRRTLRIVARGADIWNGEGDRRRTRTECRARPAVPRSDVIRWRSAHGRGQPVHPDDAEAAVARWRRSSPNGFSASDARHGRRAAARRRRTPWCGCFARTRPGPRRPSSICQRR
jgi:alkanesulfonate monooxygenase SsuD/methylene tetrahydromethanopterin reductase-like flavin-dependent oxidoreductase (luciferase family)